MDEKRIQEFLQDKIITVLKKKYYLDGEFIGTFADLCLKLITFDDLNNKEKDYLEQISIKPCGNRQRKKVSKYVMIQAKECSKTLTLNSKEGADVTLKGAEGFKASNIKGLKAVDSKTKEIRDLGDFDLIYTEEVGDIEVKKVKSLSITFSDEIEVVLSDDEDYENKKYILEKDFEEINYEDQEKLLSKLSNKPLEEKKKILDENLREIIGFDPWDKPPCIFEEYFDYNRVNEYLDLMIPVFERIMFFIDMRHHNFRDQLMNKNYGLYIYEIVLEKIKGLFESQPDYLSLDEWSEFHERNFYFFMFNELEYVTQREVTYTLMMLISQEFHNKGMTSLLLSMGYPQLTKKQEKYMRVTDKFFNFKYLM